MNDCFTYGGHKKRIQGIMQIVFGGLLVAIALIYFVFLREANPLAGTFVSDWIKHIYLHISQLSLLGVFYVFFFGGLFFLTVPLEPVFIKALLMHNPVGVLLIALFGITCSYTVNYLLGYKFSGVSRKLISIKQFYKLKAFINRRGQIGVLIFNLIGTGSQAATFILGVFRYNKHRTVVFTAAGQITRWTAIMLLVMYGGNLL